MALFGRDRAIARLLAAGHTEQDVARELSISVAMVKSRLKLPEFVTLLEQMSQRVDEKMEERIVEELLKTELEAAIELRTLLRSKDEKVRLAAVESALNRAGKRGKPAEKSEQKVATLDLNKPMGKQLEHALRDPAVRDYLDARPELRGLLAQPQGEGQQDEEIIVYSSDSETQGEAGNGSGDTGLRHGTSGGSDSSAGEGHELGSGHGSANPD